MNYYENIVNDDISVLEYKKSNYTSYAAALSSCVRKLKNYESNINDCKDSLTDFLINEKIFANNKIDSLIVNVNVLIKYLEDTLILLVNENIKTIQQRILELSVMTDVGTTNIQNDSIPSNKKSNMVRFDWEP